VCIIFFSFFFYLFFFFMDIKGKSLQKGTLRVSQPSRSFLFFFFFFLSVPRLFWYYKHAQSACLSLYKISYFSLPYV
jgi:hypothetical protein